MLRRNLSSRILLAGLAFASLSSSAVLGAQDRSESCAVSGDATVHVSNLAGSVEVTGWSQGEVSVAATLGEAVKDLSFSCEGGRVTIEVPLKEGRNSYKDGDADAELRIQVPAYGNLVVETVSANIRVSELSGSVELASVSGTVVFSGDAEEVEAASVSGNVDIQGTADSLEAESVSGSVTIARATDQVSASSVSGQVKVLGGIVTRGELESISGALTFRGDIASGGRLEVESHSGEVSIALPSGASAKVDASTFSGGIANGLTSEAGDSRRRSGREVEFVLGGGTGTVSVETFSGAISFEPY